ncbi:MAG: hypothetical protein ACOY0T_27525 [Myxococcota bacterium]
MNKTPLVSICVFATVFLMASCGSSDDKPGASAGNAGTNTGGSSAGGSGSSAGGRTNTAGNSSGGASNGGTGNGGAADGGTGTGGAEGGEGGGTNVNPNACPTEKPEAMTACTRRSGQPCTYADGGCVCTDQLWACYSSTDCPAAAPANAEACTFNGMQCAFADLVCSCSTNNGWTCETPCPSGVPSATEACVRATNRTCRYDATGAPVTGGGGTVETTCSCVNGTYTCVSQADCPTDVPTNSSACSAVTLNCRYTGAQCTCATGGTWACTLDCPAATPTAGDACQRPADQACRYSGGALVTGGGGAIDASCTCQNGVFACATTADCPAAAPEDASACTLSGITCNYAATSCRCRTSTAQWSCMTSDPGGGGAGGGGGSGGQ